MVSPFYRVGTKNQTQAPWKCPHSVSISLAQTLVLDVLLVIFLKTLLEFGEFLSLPLPKRESSR